MSTTLNQERNALEEKLLNVLLNDILKDFIDDVYRIIINSNKTYTKTIKLDDIIDKTAKERILYSERELVGAYIIAHEYEKLKKLVEEREISLIKIEYNNKLSEQIFNTIIDLHKLLDDLVERCKKTRNDNIFDGTFNKLEEIKSVITYLSDFANKISRENKELSENINTIQENIKTTILDILERL